MLEAEGRYGREEGQNKGCVYVNTRAAAVFTQKSTDTLHVIKPVCARCCFVLSLCISKKDRKRYLWFVRKQTIWQDMPPVIFVKQPLRFILLELIVTDYFFQYNI